MATVDLKKLKERAERGVEANAYTSVHGGEFRFFTCLSEDMLALIRRVERYEKALRHYEAQWVIGPFRERVDIGGVAREALTEETDSVGLRPELLR